MDTFALIVFFGSIFLLFYVFIGFPLLISILSRFFGRRLAYDVSSDFQRVAILIPAHNEQEVIEKKINNHLNLKYPEERFSIWVISDSSTDRTSEIASEYAKRYPGKVNLIEINDFLGKTNAINKSVSKIDADILVFSDANVYLEENALKHINGTFFDQKVGCVAGQLTYINQDEEGAAESNGLYWRYEEAIKKAESLTGSMMGADGSIFAIRKKLFRILPNYVLDDFCTSMGVIAQGYSLKFNENVKAFEKGAERKSEEFSRKVRISNRSYNSYRYMRAEMYSQFSFVDLWKLFSHKVLRWYSIFFMITAFVSNIYLVFSFSSLIFDILLWGQVAFYCFSVASSFLEIPVLGRVFNIFQYFLMANLASGIGIAQSLFGKKTVLWKKAVSAR
ncbi:glycosyltransferase family 2 protein [Microbulbifer sp. ALW1]|uniref:glycosyltransferase family 2 protein n=1 Tax=Microbulbifer sp. (strain ALW1) TaxID=1516059 RepID=UPI00135766D6|nr:glycosyltransferase family 2 protein [Microbulbifer sp. ALW1]